MQGHTGYMSAITVFLKLGGSSMRLLTTLVEIGKDKALLTGYGLGASLNGILMAQVCVMLIHSQFHSHCSYMFVLP